MALHIVARKITKKINIYRIYASLQGITWQQLPTFTKKRKFVLKGIFFCEVHFFKFSFNNNPTNYVQ